MALFLAAVNNESVIVIITYSFEVFYTSVGR